MRKTAGVLTLAAVFMACLTGCGGGGGSSSTPGSTPKPNGVKITAVSPSSILVSTQGTVAVSVYGSFSEPINSWSMELRPVGNGGVNPNSFAYRIGSTSDSVITLALTPSAGIKPGTYDVILFDDDIEVSQPSPADQITFI